MILVIGIYRLANYYLILRLTIFLSFLSVHIGLHNKQHKIRNQRCLSRFVLTIVFWNVFLTVGKNIFFSLIWHIWIYAIVSRFYLVVLKIRNARFGKRILFSAWVRSCNIRKTIVVLIILNKVVNKRIQTNLIAVFHTFILT